MRCTLRLRPWLPLALSLVALGCRTTVRSAGGPPRALATKTDQLFAAWDEPDSPGCALGIVQDGRLVYKRGYGSANLEYRAPLTERSVFRIASVSKQFTATCVALLEEQGMLSLDDSVRVYVPELAEYAEHVTLRHMLHHTSGLPEYLRLMKESGHFVRPMDFFDNAEALRVLADVENAVFPAGDRGQYCNSNYFLMSLVVERVSGQTLREFADAYLFGPLGMTSTYYHDDITQVVPNRATGYRVREGGGFAIDETSLEIVGDGGVFTTVEDLLRWDQNFYDNRLGEGRASLIELLQTRGQLNRGERTRYGLGLRIDEHNKRKRVSHGGSWVGFRTNLMRFPEHKFTVICLCNLAEIRPRDLAEKIADLWLAGRH